jgi:hypothetical protein
MLMPCYINAKKKYNTKIGTTLFEYVEQNKHTPWP